MGLILDSSIFIEAEKGKFDLERLLDTEAATQSVFITTITASELLHGVERADSPKRRAKRSAFVHRVIDNIPAIPFGMSDARVHARIWACLVSRGTMIGAHDLIIAAISISGEHHLGTLNIEEFRRIEGLKLFDVANYREPCG